MSCDIHAYIEYKSHDSWRSFSSDELKLGRDYMLFALMAGVRLEYVTPVMPPRGIPDDLSWEAREDYHLQLIDGDERNLPEHCCTREQAERYVKYGSKRVVFDGIEYVIHPDWHTPSWLTLDELREVQRRYATSEMQDGSDEGFQLRMRDFILNDRSGPFPEPPLRPRSMHVELAAVIGAMSALNALDKTPRLVFWFDN